MVATKNASGPIAKEKPMAPSTAIEATDRMKSIKKNLPRRRSHALRVKGGFIRLCLVEWWVAARADRVIPIRITLTAFPPRKKEGKQPQG